MEVKIWTTAGVKREPEREHYAPALPQSAAPGALEIETCIAFLGDDAQRWKLDRQGV